MNGWFENPIGQPYTDPWGGWGSQTTPSGGETQDNPWYIDLIEAALNVGEALEWWDLPGIGNNGQQQTPYAPPSGGQPGGTVANGQTNACLSYFMRQPSGAPRMKSEVVVENPVTGRLHWYKNAGRPVLWSGDIAAQKRVRKVAARAARKR